MRALRKPGSWIDRQSFQEIVDDDAPESISEFLAKESATHIIPVEPAEHYRISLPRETYDRLHDSILAEQLRRYIEHHERPGPFVLALLANDLRETAAAADVFTAHRLPELIEWVCEYAPPGCWGDERAVRTWLAPQIAHSLQLHRKTA